MGKNDKETKHNANNVSAIKEWGRRNRDPIIIGLVVTIIGGVTVFAITKPFSSQKSTPVSSSPQQPILSESTATEEQEEESFPLPEPVIPITDPLAVAHNSEGFKFLQQEKFTQALAEFNLALDIDPTYAEAHYYCGSVYYRLGEYDKAIDEHNKAISNHLSHLGNAHYERGNTYFVRGNKRYNQGEFNEAMADYDSAIYDYHQAIDVGHPYPTDVHYACANAYFNKQEFENAIEYYTKALDGANDEHYPTRMQVFINRAAAYLGNKQYDEGIEDYKLSKSTTKTTIRKLANAYYERGVMHYRKEEYTNAIADYKLTIDNNPEHYNAYIDRGNAYCKLNLHDDAIEDFNWVIENYPGISNIGMVKESRRYAMSLRENE